MEGEINDVVPCSSLAVENIIRIGTAGGIWGSCIAPSDARSKGLTGIAYTSFVAKTIGKLGFQCGVVAGIFTFTRCGIQKYRGKNDWVNSFVASGVVGAAVIAGSRSWTQGVQTAGLICAFGSAVDYYRSRTS